jgi:hypothetical protein
MIVDYTMYTEAYKKVRLSVVHKVKRRRVSGWWSRIT